MAVNGGTGEAAWDTGPTSKGLWEMATGDMAGEQDTSSVAVADKSDTDGGAASSKAKIGDTITGSPGMILRVEVRGEQAWSFCYV